MTFTNLLCSLKSHLAVVNASECRTDIDSRILQFWLHIEVYTPLHLARSATYNAGVGRSRSGAPMNWVLRRFEHLSPL